MCACMFVCVHRQAIKNHSREMKLITNQTSPTAFYFLYMTLAIDITDGRGLSNKVHRKLLLKKSKVMQC